MIQRKMLTISPVTNPTMIPWIMSGNRFDEKGAVSTSRARITVFW